MKSICFCMNMSLLGCYILIYTSQGRVSLVGNSSLSVLNSCWFISLRVRCYLKVSLRGRDELEPLDKIPVRADLSSVDIRLVEGISVMKKYSISVSLLHGMQ